ncbi:MAG: sensor histidine kinase [Kofleriaceae bacterium]
MRVGPLILYVDSDDANRARFAQAAGSEFDVRVVEDRVAATAVLEVDDVALVVVHAGMTDMSAHDLLAELAARAPLTIRALISAPAHAAASQAAVDDGLADRCLLEPWDADLLRALLRWGLATSHTGRAAAARPHRLLEVERLATLGCISATILHDLRAPLGRVLLDGRHLATYFEPGAVIARALGGGPLSPADAVELARGRDEVGELLVDLVQAAVEVNAITDKLLELFGRAAPGAPGDAASPLVAILHATTLCGRAVAAAQARVRYVGPASLPMVALSEAELTQVLANLITNAAQALRDADQPRGTIVLDATAAADRLRITVADDGPGMSAETLARVGRRFYSTRSGRAGLGLAQCYQLVDPRGGVVEVASSPGEGTTVTVSLPWA